ncbi:hypothetical protein ACFQBQ_16430 [Granulicella cerasi]|uniref:Uncharacterized protein n=1 Tax=Granulicella cerasi TaxID=741063 RepID=A0ABW1ZCB2_9BACT|nr:hypothetical protein [Granulicella cerasi]
MKNSREINACDEFNAGARMQAQTNVSSEPNDILLTLIFTDGDPTQELLIPAARYGAIPFVDEWYSDAIGGAPTHQVMDRVVDILGSRITVRLELRRTS